MFQNEPLQLQKLQEGDKNPVSGSRRTGDDISAPVTEKLFPSLCNRRYSGKRKKGAVGVRGMRLGDRELLTDVWQLNNEKEEIIMIKEKAVHLNRLKNREP